MKKVIFLIVLIMLMSVFTAKSQTAIPPTIGDGTSGNPYQIATLNNLYWISQNTAEWNKYYIQTVDIDAWATIGWDYGKGFTPIGNNTTKFTGGYNGAGHTIGSLYIERPETNYIGLFGYTNGSKIDSLGLTNVNIIGNNYIGGLVGYNYYYSTVSNSYSTGSINGTDNVGGLVGYNYYYSTVSNSYSTGSINGTDNVGGLVGYNYYSTVSNSYSTGNINGTDNVGGLVGYNSSSTVSNSYSTGSISGTGKVGGLVGYNFLSTVSNSYSTGSVSGTSKVGGLVGYSYNYSTVSNSFYDTETSGQITSSGGTGKTTTEMKDYNTFTDVSTEGLTTAWDFVGNFNDDTGINDYWSIGSGNNGYLSFTWQDSLFSIASSDSITNINTTTATGNGNILYLGSSNPTAYGFCWNTIGNPDISGSTTNEGQVSSTVSFTTNITGLTIGEKYYSRAYTTNEYGTYYGKVLEFGAGGIGLVTTDSVFNTTISTAIGYGNITDLGTSNPTAYGFCWNTTGNPDTSDSKTDEGTTSSTGAFSTNITGLLLDTIYYVKAYVTNVNGTYYGDEIEIVTIFPYGSGTELDPYQIASLNNLQWLMENSAEWDKYYIQTTDINASITNVWADSSGFTPIGNNTTNFTGEYNGASHIIDSLYINRPKTSNIGLFGPINGAKIDSLGLTNMDITGKENVGGLVGYNINSTISNSYSTGSVSGSNDVGGLVGYNYKNSTISNSFSTGSVSGSITVGGLVGNNYQNSKVSNSYCTGSVTGTNYVGGLVGYNQFAVISNNYSAGSVTGSSYVGGLVGYNFNYSLIKNSYSTGSVTGSSYVGGLVGDNKYSSTISNSFYDTQTSGQTTSAGGTGKTTAEMKNYNTFTDVSTEGLTTAWDFVGNFNDDTETNDYWCIDGNDGYLIFTWQDSLFSIVLSNSITNITATTATGNGNILYLGSSNPTAYGFCWNTTGNPDTSDSKTNEGTASSTGTFSTNITGLLSNTIYYARAYVTNEYGTYYGKTLKYVFTALSGTGTSDDPYQIKSLGNLLWLMQSPAEWDKYYIQTADINAGATSGWDTGKGFIPIGNSTTEFTGEYNGAGHTIDSLFINSGTDNIGLFGYTNGSKIDSLGLTNVDITGKDNVGSFAGYTLSSTVSNSYSTGNISGSDYIGGLIGNNYYFSTINNSYNKVSVTGSSYIGGLVGYNYHHSTVSNSYSTGSVSGLSNVGGLIGVNEYLSTISNSFWDTETSGIDTSAGGIGKTTAEMKTFYNYVDGTEASWDFMGETINGTNDFWGMNPNENNGYPFLAWQGFRNTVCYGILTSSINETACFSYTVPSGDETHILSGVYMDTIPSINGCDSVITINLTIYTVDTSVTQTGATLTANAGSGAIYQWLNCNNLYAIIDGETNQSFTPIVNGNYAVEITEYGCTDTSSCYNVTVGIIERISNSFINIYPNPANSFIVVESKEINIESIEIINITGKVVKQIIVDGNKATIDLSDKTKGLYMIRLITDKGIIIKKVMLE